MGLQHRRSKRRGYTLMEMMTVVGIIGILSMVAIYRMRSGRHGEQELQNITRETLGRLQLARTLSVNGNRSGSNDTASPVMAPVSAPVSSPLSPPLAMPRAALPAAIVAASVNETIVASEFRIETPSRIELWQVTDQGNRNLAKVIDLAIDDPTNPIEIVAPVAPAVIRFKNGIRDMSSPGLIDLIDRRTGRHSYVEIGATGMRIRSR